MACISGPVRIGNCSGFYGDRLAAMREMLTGGDLDYLTGDYLAELTMLILARDRAKSPDRGYAKTFLTQLEECLGTALDAGVRIVANAGGLNPAGLAAAVRALAERLGLDAQRRPRRGRRPRGRGRRARVSAAPLTANAYLGGVGHRRLPRRRRRRRRHRPGHRRVGRRRARPRPTSAGAATDYDALAGAVVAGHVIECGAQATGGNYAFFTELADLTLPRASRSPRSTPTARR